jgi:hypothetical protein
MALYPSDVRKLLQYFEDLFAHAATLQELISTDDDRTYEDIRPTYDRQAAAEFALFYLAIDDPQAFAKVVSDFQNAHPKRVH